MASLVQDNSFTDSSDQSEVEEDPVFPLPHGGEDAEIDASDAEIPVASLEVQLLPSLAPGLSTALDHRSSSPEAPDGSDTGRYYDYKYSAEH